MSSRLLNDSLSAASILPVWDIQSKSAGFRPASLFAGMAESAANETAAYNQTDGSRRSEPTEQKVAAPSIEEQIAEAYRRGFDEGEREAQKAGAADTEAVKALSNALAALKPQLSDTLCSMMLESIRNLLLRTVGFSEPDVTTLTRHCEALAALVTREMSGAELHIHPDDRALIGENPCGLALVDDSSLRRGTICLMHDDGWIEQGTQPLLDELQGLIDALGTGQ